ncbi:coagulation factor IX-like [Chironomus tepperi]|uniref:coagulation factor IX-like n=1 Tax=Chironomus tepperi TaxID=113505 RepID=UPI00391F715D
MNLKFITILLTVVATSTASAPYCIYGTTKATFLNVYEDYTCQIEIDGQLDVLNTIWGYHDPYDQKNDADVKILTVMIKSRILMTVFPSIFCDHYPNIEVIDMSEAEIEEVKINSLKNCRNLEVAQFYNNKISELDENFLSTNRRLKEIYLNYNKFTTIPENLFRNQEDLQILDLSANLLDDLPYNIFESLKNLKTLKLDINKLAILNPDWFKKLESLETLDLSSNEIDELPDNVFSSLYSLKSLNLDHNNLQTISSRSFDPHPQLEAVGFYKNSINAIDQRFIDNTKIKTLNMKGNICIDDSKITGRDIKRKLSQCFTNYKLFNEETTTTTTTTTTTRRRRTKPTTTATTTTTTTTTAPTTKPTRRTTTTTKSTTIQTTTPRSSQTTTQMIATSHSRTFEIDEDECGLRPTGLPLIIKGIEPEPGSYPWMAVLIVDTNVHCGGVLISKAKIITAGHCIKTKTLRTVDAKEITVVLGGHNLNLLHEIGRFAFGVREVHVHSNWNQFENRYDSDIAVLILREDVTYNDHIHPICVAHPNTEATRVSDGTIVGYGKTEDKSREYSNVPRQAQAPIHDTLSCIRKFPRIQQISHSTTFCGGLANGTGACTGDSGGGLFVRIGKIFYLRGIVSSSLRGGEYGCDVDSYSLFTDISQFIPWIYNIGVNDVSIRSDGGSPVEFVPPWLTTTQRTGEIHRIHDNRPVWN